MSIWNGAIVPGLRKSIGTVRFVPLKDMTSEMWRVLDYENLRETAKNKLAEKARDGILGFFDVNIVEKAGPAKPRYFQGATAVDLATWDDAGVAPPGFENTADVDTLTPEAEELDRWVDRISGAIIGGIAAREIAKHLAENTEAPPRSPEEIDSPAGVDIRGGTAMMGGQDARDARELLEQAERGWFDNLDDIDAGLMMALYLFDKYPLTWLETLIDELEDAQDEF